MKFYQVDSFTKTVFAGNPAAVFVLDKPISNELKALIAREMNLSETAFVTDLTNLQWFTPGSEVDLCGHATLAAAHILFEKGFIKSDRHIFKSRSGELPVRKVGSLLELDFPSQPPTLKNILGKNSIYSGSNGEDAVIVVDSEEAVRGFVPDYEAISNLDERGLIVTAKSNEGYVYRAFFPKLSVPEDPVTGSANTLLAPYWSGVTGEKVFKVRQLSERGGDLEVELTENRVLIRGSAITVLEGELYEISFS